MLNFKDIVELTHKNAGVGTNYNYEKIKTLVEESILDAAKKGFYMCKIVIDVEKYPDYKDIMNDIFTNSDFYVYEKYETMGKYNISWNHGK